MHTAQQTPVNAEYVLSIPAVQYAGTSLMPFKLRVMKNYSHANASYRLILA